MAEVQLSGPLTDENFTDDQWQAVFGSNAGIVGDTDGTAYDLTLPPATDIVEIGSTTIDSRCVVGGYGHSIPAGTTQSLEIPPSTNPTVGRTDLIVARMNISSFTSPPGPVRLHRIAGTEGSTTSPAHGTTLPSPVDMVLYRITRVQGDSLNQATVVDRRQRSGWHWLLPPTAPLPQSAPLGSTATRNGTKWRRDFDGSSVDWVVDAVPRVLLTGTGVATDGDDYDVRAGSTLSREVTKRRMNFVVGIAGDPANPNPEVDGERRVGRLAAADRPAQAVALAGFAKNTAGVARAASGRVDPDGWVIWHWVSSGGLFPTGSNITLAGSWETTA